LKNSSFGVLKFNFSLGHDNDEKRVRPSPLSPVITRTITSQQTYNQQFTPQGDGLTVFLKKNA